MLETGVVLGPDWEVLYWHEPEGRTGGSLPDCPTLWDIFWTQRKTLVGFAHSHPGSGIPHPSWEDLTTFAAVEQGLGIRLSWWITSSDKIILLEWAGPGKHDYSIELLSEDEEEANLRWANDLRKKSA